MTMAMTKTQNIREMPQELLAAINELVIHKATGYYNAGKTYGRLQYEPGKTERILGKITAIAAEHGIAYQPK
jgi:hypothetical protein